MMKSRKEKMISPIHISTDEQISIPFFLVKPLLKMKELAYSS
jgi:hypothetical protein